MIVYPKSNPRGFVLEQEACDLMTWLLNRHIPRPEAVERAARFQQERNAEVVSPKTQKKGGIQDAM